MQTMTYDETRAMTPTLPCYAAQELTQGGKIAQIQLGDQLYTLRITRAEKLILTK